MRDAWTIRISFFTNAIMNMINSTAFPKLTLSKWPKGRPQPVRNAFGCESQEASQRDNGYRIEGEHNIWIITPKSSERPLFSIEAH